MGFRKALYTAGFGVASLAILCAFQSPFRQFPGVEYEDFEIPPDWNQSAEWAFARLMYPPGPNDGYAGRFDGDWREGLSLWTQDYPRADRHFSQALRRLTLVSVRSVEQPINLDEGDAYDWPWLYAVQVGEWGLTDEQAQEMREYLLRGGFFMADDFHGTFEWEMFEQRIKKVFPDRPIVDIPDKDPIFHTVYDLDERYQVPGYQYVYSHQIWEKDATGKVPHWRAMYDDHGRIMVAMCHNMDLGDSWENADDPKYDAKFSALGLRLGVNYITYAMSH